jgi:hypothetical protein
VGGKIEYCHAETLTFWINSEIEEFKEVEKEVELPTEKETVNVSTSKFEENEYVRVIPFNGITPQGFQIGDIYKVVATTLSLNGDQVYLVMDCEEAGYYISECFLESFPMECMEKESLNRCCRLKTQDESETLDPTVLGSMCKDDVNSPSHYTSGGIEVIEYMKAKLTQEELCGYLKGNVIKYISRAGKKEDTLKDYKKAQWYLNKLITEMEN